MQNELKEVYFGEYCNKCVFLELSESEDPCWDCLKQPVNEHSHKPVRFVEDQNKKEKKKDGRNSEGRTVEQNKRIKRGRKDLGGGRTSK